MTNPTIIETRTGIYRVPSIDNRDRAGRAMWRLVRDAFGTCMGTLVRKDGTTAPVLFQATGWGVNPPAQIIAKAGL